MHSSSKINLSTESKPSISKPFKKFEAKSKRRNTSSYLSIFYFLNRKFKPPLSTDQIKQNKKKKQNRGHLSLCRIGKARERKNNRIQRRSPDW